VLVKWLVLSALVFGCSGCLATRVAQRAGVSGWFRADLQPKTADGYKERFAPVDLDEPTFPCGELTARERDGSTPIIVLVPGVGADGPEMHVALSTLMARPPASVFMFRWLMYDERDQIAKRLADGVTRLAECLPDSDGRILVVAHSAGGVLASYAVSHVQLPPLSARGPWVTVLTVASPLAGKMTFQPPPSGRQEKMFMLDLGTRITAYPPPARGIRVVHLRTHSPADPMMDPVADLVPNDPAVGVPGAPQLDLPGGLDHPGALEYVVTEISNNRWLGWRDGAP
jgi:predicted alpha/beta hydrolase family esterase